ncbi:MAG: family N-acetyltransferase [Friedmanniella sp.]|nr:family N-acetyltransferase [Friedmanniella sp.]
MSSPADASVADSVRLAWPTEAPAIAELQRRSWAETFPAGTVRELLAVSLEDMARSWSDTISRPSDARLRVLVAVEQHRVVGYAITLPAGDPDADPGTDGEVDQLVIDPVARRRGHGSRLLNACVDTLRADGFGRGLWWVLAADDDLRTFVGAAGWAADGAFREIGTSEEGVRLKQVRLHTDLGDDPAA